MKRKPQQGERVRLSDGRIAWTRAVWNDDGPDGSWSAFVVTEEVFPQSIRLHDWQRWEPMGETSTHWSYEEAYLKGRSVGLSRRTDERGPV